MKRKIIGVTVGSPLPKPNLMQTDPAKGDYIKGKEEFLEQLTVYGGSGLSKATVALLQTILSESLYVNDQSENIEKLKEAFNNAGWTDEDKQNLINEVLEQAKAKGEFDGKDGVDGKDGYTPVKGVDYFDGKDGYTPIKGVDYFDGKDGVDGKNGVDGYNPVRGKDYWTSTDRQSIVTDMLTSEEVRKMQQDILDLRADLEYVPIDITSISSTVTKAEMGSVVNKVTISWVVNKTPNVQTLDGSEVAVNLRSVALTDQGIVANKTFIVTATDERNTTDTASTSITFLNGVYYGAAAAPETVDSTFILGLTKELTNAKGRTITVNAAEGKSIWYALPTRLGACNFSVGGFSGGFDLVNTIQFTNASGYTESYYVYASAKTGLGETKVVVS